MKNKYKKLLVIAVLVIIYLLMDHFLGGSVYDASYAENSNEIKVENFASLAEVKDYSGNAYAEINNNIPFFNEEDYSKKSFENYSQLDSLGRCGVAYAMVGKETIPEYGKEREDISIVKPTGWVQKKHNGEFLYNRCHLIGYQLTAENANELNLITGTRYFNVTGMLPFENKVAKYIHDNKKKHVLYRVTPVFKGDNLLASGVEIEASSVEDKGKALQFNVYIYNIQPGVQIDYATGNN